MNLVKLFYAVFCLTFSLSALAGETFSNTLEEGAQLRYFNQLQHAGLMVKSAEHEHILYAKNARQSFIPASTIKLITALLALQHWGADYRFKTEFYLTKAHEHSPTLLVKGYGDPFLVSEELAFIAKRLAVHLKQQGISSLAGIQLDTGYYEGGVKFSGASQTDNPYDAVSSALAANFNTLYVQKTAEGFISAEPQTPITPTATRLAHDIQSFQQTKSGLKKRINLGQNEVLAQRYFAELLAAFLRQEGVNVAQKIEWQSLSEVAVLLYEHRNRQVLAEIIRSMMQYSTNFIANQLALNLSREITGVPASAKTVARVYQQRLTEQFGWQDFIIQEGAGLSRENRLSPEQLMDVLKVFAPWCDLLPEIEANVYAKSGTLLGVSTLAGYLYRKENSQKKWYPFAVMINQKVPFRYRNQLAQELSERLK